MDLRQGGYHGFLGELLVVVRLEIEPHCGRPAEVAFETQGGIDGDRPLALDDLIDADGVVALAIACSGLRGS